MLALRSNLRRLPNLRPFAARCVHAEYYDTVIPTRLDYDVSIPEQSDGKKGAVIMLHGFLGSKKNFYTVSKAMMEKLNRPIYRLDLRNHGTSPHVEPMTYDAMAEDVWKFIQRHHLSDVTVLGHSMGGKVAMSVALKAGYEKPGDILSKLIAVDISPIRSRMSSQFVSYVDAMADLEKVEGVRKRAEADAHLARFEQDRNVRYFLLSNLLPFHSDNPKAQFRVPLDIFKRSVHEIGDFPFASGERTWTGKTLVLKGTRSNYVKDKYRPTFDSFFPNSTFKDLDTGHWVHAEKPEQFVQTVCDFINEVD